jgi:hypothetical protein
MNNDVADTLLMNFTPRIGGLLGQEVDHTGNSLQDLDLSRAGVSFGMKMWSDPMTNEEAAQMLSGILCANPADCSP